MPRTSSRRGQQVPLVPLAPAPGPGGRAGHRAPVVREQLATGGVIRRSAAVVASWARYAEGFDEQGQPIEVVDRLRDSLVPLARRQREDPDAFIADRDVFGDLADEKPLLLHGHWMPGRGSSAG